MWKIENLVLLAPLQSFRLPGDHMPDLDSVKGGCFFNLHAEYDFIVSSSAKQNFQRVPWLRDREREVVLENELGHWLPTEVDKWIETGFGNDVVSGCTDS